MVEQWVKEIKLLSDVALTELQAVYSCSPVDIGISLPTLL